MLRLTRKLLQGIAKILTRYVSSIEKFLAREDLSAKHALSDYSDEHPPAHWLEKVRRGAPQLLDNRSSGETRTAAYSSETKNASGFNPLASSDTNEKPPAHWIKRIQHSAPHLFEEQPVHRKNASNQFATHDGEQPQLSDRNEADFSKADIPVKQSYTARTKLETDRELLRSELSGQTSENTWSGSFDVPEVNSYNTVKQHNKTPLEALAGRTRRYGRKAENQLNNDAPSKIPGKRTTIHQTESERTNPIRPSIKRSKTESEISSSARQFRTLRLNATIPDTSTQNKKYQRQHSTPHAQFTITHRAQIIAQYPHGKRKTPQQFPNTTIEPHSSVNKDAVIQCGSNETSMPIPPDKATHFSLSYQPAEQLNINRQNAIRHSQNTTDTVATDIASGLNQKQYTVSMFKANKPFEPDLPRWPSLPGEKERRLYDDWWPELPEEKMPESDKTIRPVIHFAQLQEAIRRQHRSELEQRGVFWNG
ncbi:MAG: hypothetical protein KF908_00570 [Nitrosomonas sp.]|nr:hypothetical protein [Nitrosomonas sp.]MCW5607865.1 hypothetical protein [Nitrosomonas sp.]